MSIEECAAKAVEWWDRSTAITMVAIAGGESSYNANARGDHLSIFSQFYQDLYAPYACDSYLSFGYWQIFLGVHHGRILAMSGISDPCGQAGWLFNAFNNARAAASILADQGFIAWSIFNNGAYLAFLAVATAAVDEALGAGPPQQPAPPAGEVNELFADVPIYSNTAYSVHLYWQGTNDVLWCDISRDPSFGWFHNKEVGFSSSTPCPSGFSDGPQLLPDERWYWRMWNGDKHFPGPSWLVAPLPPAPPPVPPPDPHFLENLFLKSLGCPVALLLYVGRLVLPIGFLLWLL